MQSTTETPMVKVNLGEFLLTASSLHLPIPEYRNADLSASRHLYSTEYSGPTLPRQLREFANRESIMHRSLLLETPNAGIPILRIRATCPRSDRRSRLNRGIALRDSDVHGIISLANPDLPICDALGFFLHLKANLLAPSPRSNGPRDFAILLDNFKSSVLSLDEEISTPPPPFCATSTGVSYTVNQRTIPSEISRTHSPCSFFNTFPKVMKSFGSLGTHARKNYNLPFSAL
jgi:hypothetical protein